MYIKISIYIYDTKVLLDFIIKHIFRAYMFGVINLDTILYKFDET